jgi:hypothetical protein
MTDVIDAHLALLAHDGDAVVTSDPGALAVLLRATGRSAGTVRC